MTFRDIRLALRSLVYDRSVSAIVIFCLALGIGVKTLIPISFAPIPLRITTRVA
jgi:hypothetical protein